MSTARTSTRRGSASVYPKTIHPTKMEDRAAMASRMALVASVARAASEWPYSKEPLSVSRNVLQHWKYYGKVPADMDLKETHRIVDLIELDLNRRQALREEKRFLREEGDFEWSSEDRIQMALWLDTLATLNPSDYPFSGPTLFISKEDLNNWAHNTNEYGELRGVPKRYNLLALLEAAYSILMTPKRQHIFKSKTRRDLEAEMYETLVKLQRIKKSSDQRAAEIKDLETAVRVLVERIQELKKES